MVVDVMILEGIKRAIAGGADLKDAMMSFYNAGYEKADVEEAAREYQMMKFAESTQNGAQTNSSEKTPQPKIMNPNLPNSPAPTQQVPNNALQTPKPVSPKPIAPKVSKAPQKVSSYGQKKSHSGGKIILVFLVLLLLFLVGSLIAAFVFKSQIIDFLNGNL